jgi:glucose-6-phosphate dehydrogenase assembly protein OpcA
VDRLIFDSQSWRDPRQQFALLEASIAAAQSRLTLCDLNWARSLRLRQAVSQMFDHPENVPILQNPQHIEIAHAPEYRSTALLLVGWFVAQLRLTPLQHEGKQLIYSTAEGSEVRFDLAAEPGRSISRCNICSGDAGVKVERDAVGDFFHVEVRLADGRIYRHLMPAGNNQTLSLLTNELGLGSRHRVYLKALAATRDLL